MNLKFFTKGMMKILYLKPLQLINTYKAYECQPVSDSAWGRSFAYSKKTFQEQNPAENRSLVFETLRKPYLMDVLFKR